MRAVTTTERMFKGQSAAERKAERRARLDEAALDIIGTRGWGEATMTEICRTAGLTERYFYESYRNRDELYLALLDRLAEEVRDAVLAPLSTGPQDPRERIEASARALVDVLFGDPRKGRAALSEGLDNPVLQRRRREIIHSIGALLETQRDVLFGPQADAARSAMAIAAISGATSELITRRLDGILSVTDEQFAGYLADTALALLQA